MTTLLFTSNVLSLVKFNGKIIGKCHKSPLKFESPYFDTAIIEILPFCENKNYCNQSFLLSNAGILSCKSSLVKITKFSKDFYGLDFCLKEIFNKSCIKAVYQQNFKEKNLNHSATVFYDGAYSLTLECEQFLETYILPELIGIIVSEIFIPAPCFLFKGFNETGAYIKIIAFDDDYYVLYDGFVKEVKAENNKLYLSESFNDYMGHILEKVYVLENKNLKILEEKKLYSKGKDLTQIPREVIPYVFLESIKNSFFEEEKTLLTKELSAADINYFKNFFGDFTDILQNPATSNLCLIKKITDNYFEATDYNFEFENGKISNFFPI